jgi:hypothetical protein
MFVVILYETYLVRRIQEERQERRKIKQQMGIADVCEKKSRFDEPEEVVATGASIGIGM